MAIVEAAKVTLRCTTHCLLCCYAPRVHFSVERNRSFPTCARAPPAPLLPTACCSPAPSLLLQERIRGQRDIRDAASRGDIALVQDHLLADPACVNTVGGW